MCIKEGKVGIKDLYEAFSQWWIANESEEPWKMRTLQNKLRERGYIAVKGGRSGGASWEGISLK
ncbi:MAG: hypothetical protein ABSG71_14750 [Thermodesulfobacteriota bacterium]|jgi:hypothetical protein